MSHNDCSSRFKVRLVYMSVKFEEGLEVIEVLIKPMLVWGIYIYIYTRLFIEHL